MRIEALDRSAHDRSGFSCSRPELDDWLRENSSPAARYDTAQSFVLVEGDDPRVRGYFSLAAHAVERVAVHPDQRSGQLAIVPAVLLARLAVERDYQGQGLGERLLAEAVRRVVDVSSIIGAALMVVDALDEEAAQFYERFGFVRWPPDGLRLFARIKDIRKTFER